MYWGRGSMHQMAAIHGEWLVIIMYMTSQYLCISVCTAEGIRCTEQACTCSLPPSPGPCRAAIPAYHYDSNSGTCRQFVYGGCGGNANKFRTVRDCLTHCAPSGKRSIVQCHINYCSFVLDRCLQPKVIGVCDALFPSYFFNSSSGMCEQFNYGGCGGNENRFSSGLECLQACSPDSESSLILMLLLLT